MQVAGPSETASPNLAALVDQTAASIRAAAEHAHGAAALFDAIRCLRSVLSLSTVGRLSSTEADAVAEARLTHASGLLTERLVELTAPYFSEAEIRQGMVAVCTILSEHGVYSYREALNRAGILVAQVHQVLHLRDLDRMRLSGELRPNLTREDLI